MVSVSRVFSHAVLCVVLASLLAGCASYKVRPLRKLDRSTAKYIAEKDGVSIYVAPIEKKELKEYFNGETLPKDLALTPFLITVQNNSAQKIILHAHEMGIKTISADELSQFLGLYTEPSTWDAVKMPLGVTLGTLAIPGVPWLVNAPMMVHCSGVSPAVAWFTLASFIAIPCSLGFGYHYYVKKQQFNADCCADLHNKIFSKLKLMSSETETRLMVMHLTQELTRFSMIMHRELRNTTWSAQDVVVLTSGTEV